MTLNGSLTLCARADLEPSRFYSGSLAHLRVFNTALTAAQMKALYDSQAPGAVGSTPAAERGGPQQATSQPQATQDPRCDASSPCTLFNGVYMCAQPDGTLTSCGPSAQSAPAVLPVDAPRAAPAAPASAPTATDPAAAAAAAAAVRINGQPLCSLTPTPPPGLATVSSCGSGYVCAPLSTQQLQANVGASAPSGSAVGVCAFAPQVLLLPAAGTAPAPMAFFPLNSPSLETFPLGDYKGINDGAGIVEDALFRGALRCRAGDSDLVRTCNTPHVLLF